MNLFTDHPRSVGETYWQHALRAIQYSFKLLRASLACFFHACFPFIFQTYTGDTIREIEASLAQRKLTNK